jgi:ribosomal protein S18 acetylase RimI-like enzyme
MIPIKIDIATASNAADVVNVIVHAFSADPSARWIFPDRRQYLNNFPALVRVFADAAFEHGSAHCSAGFSAAALWLPPGIHPDETALFTLLQDAVPAQDQADVFALFELMEKCHPAEPHWYLPMMGVYAEKQGRGHGSALLKYALERCDAEEKSAYLEASSSKSVSLYKRHGFELLGTIQVGSSPPLFSMLRRPRCSAARAKTRSACAAATPSG